MPEGFTHPSGVTITKGRLVVPSMKAGNNTIPAGNYPLSGITSYTLVTQAPPTGCATMVIWLGALALVGASIQLLGGIEQPATGIGFAVAMLVGGWMWRKSLKPFYWIVIRTAGAEIRAMGTESQAEAQAIIDALGAAIDER